MLFRSANRYGAREMASLQIAFSPRALPGFALGSACRHFEGGAPAAAMLCLLRATASHSADLAPLIRGALDATASACVSPPQGPVPDWLRHLLDTLEGQSQTTPPRIGALARELGMHPVSLARAFRRERACSITEHLRGVRILRAGRLIARGGSGLAEIAAETGFADQPHLTRAFRAELGCTPGEFRRLVA